MKRTGFQRLLFRVGLLQYGISGLLFMSCVIGFSQDPGSSVVIYLVRHAEKADDGTKNPPLNMVGLQRAVRLNEMLRDIEFGAVYSTDFKRTIMTASPVAEQNHLKVKTYDPADYEKFLRDVLRSHQGQNILITGHSNTIPQMANMLLGMNRVMDFREDEYDSLLIIIADKMGECKLLRLRY
ncbi:MAG: histidine phosphatase family protein [Cyclobacteriaceae bacterium]|nr:histidine phosphatase family protein [Cyclobacteriaceae bacterium]